MRIFTVRLLAVLLSIGMLLGFPASCTKKEDKYESDHEQQTDQTDEYLFDDDDAVIDIEGGNLEGYNIRIASWFNLEPDPKSPHYQTFLKRKKALEDKFNCTISYIQIPASKVYETVVSTAASADPVADIIRLRSPWVVPVLAGDDLLLPVDQYFDLDDPIWNSICTQESMFKGKPYGVNSDPATSWACIWYNKTLIEKAGLKDPYEMIFTMTWTWEKWVEYSTAVSKLSTEEKHIYGTNMPNYLAFITSNGGKAVRSLNNQDKWTLNAPEATDAIKFLQNTMKSGIVGGDVKEFAEGRLGFLFKFNWANDFKDKLTDEWGILPYPIGPSYNDFTAYNEELQLMCLPKESLYPDETAKIWTELSRPYPDFDFARNTYGKYFDSIRDIETALMLQKKLSLDRYCSYAEIRDGIINGNNGSSLTDAIDGTYGRPYEEWIYEVTPMAESSIQKVWSKYK